jgi:hypothetical protein
VQTDRSGQTSSRRTRAAGIAFGRCSMARVSTDEVGAPRFTASAVDRLPFLSSSGSQGSESRVAAERLWFEASAEWVVGGAGDSVDGRRSALLRAEVETPRVGTSGPAKNPGGEPSPWKERVSVDWQRSSGTTDPAAEQGLEAEHRHRFRAVQVQRRGGNGSQRCEYGCSRGDFFEGCEGRSEDGSPLPDLAGSTFGWVVRERTAGR